MTARCSIRGCKGPCEWRLWAARGHGHEWLPFCAEHKGFIDGLDSWETEDDAQGRNTWHHISGRALMDMMRAERRPFERDYRVEVSY